MADSSPFLYSLALTSVWWEDGGIDCRLFTTPAEREDYFKGLTYTEIQSVAINDGISFNVIYNAPTDIVTGQSIQDILNKNYAVLRYKDNSNNYRYRYYFCKVQQLSGRQFNLTLSLDDIVSTYPEQRDHICPVMINRAHLNRWKNGQLDGSKTSPFFNKDGYNDNAVLKKRLEFDDIVINDDYGGAQSGMLNTFLERHVKAWLYLFLKPYGPFGKTGSLCNTLVIGDELYSNIYCVACPLTSYGDLWAKLGSMKPFQIGIGGVSYINSAYVCGAKLSYVPPFDQSQKQSYYFQEDGNNLNIKNFGSVSIDATDGVDFIIRVAPSGGNGRDIYFYTHNNPQSSDMLQGAIVVPANMATDIYQTFTFPDCVRTPPMPTNNITPRSYRYDPATYQTPNSKLMLCSINHETFTYDILSINSSGFTVYISEPLTPDITKGYMRLHFNAHDGDSIYSTTGYEENFVGLSYSVDTTFPYEITALETFLANNKNFYLQSANNIISQTASGYLGARTKGQRQGSIIKGVSSVINTSLDVDNYRNAPETLRNTSTNVFLNLLSLKNLNWYCEIWQAPEIFLKQISDFHHLNGYKYNLTDWLSLNDNTRFYFNYLQTDDDLKFTDKNLSKTLKTRLSSLFLSGVRLWHSDDRTAGLLYENMEKEIK